ncbi:MAG: helix-turn-helix transcriptional regulator [Chthoniobacteraceae bacterium]|nr:helix-turn-helix transcriptional regulator [Chthoniobacteraceae bacterium]
MTPSEYKIERQKRGTQEEVAALLCIKRLAIIRRENGTRQITREAALAICALPPKSPK